MVNDRKARARPVEDLAGLCGREVGSLHGRFMTQPCNDFWVIT